MADRPAKRARAASSSEIIAQPITDSARLTKLYESINTLDFATMRSFLLTAASESPKIANLIEAQTTSETKKDIEEKEKEKAAKEVVDFSHSSKSVWYTLNKEYSRLKCSRQFGVAHDAIESIVQTIENIKKRCPPDASYGTKSSALETLRKIGKSIVLSTGDELTKRVRQSFQWNSILEDTMKTIVKSMSHADRLDMAKEPQGDVTFLEKLDELYDLAADYCMFDGLEQVVHLLQPGVQNGEEGNSSEGPHEAGNGVDIVDLTDSSEDG